MSEERSLEQSGASWNDPVRELIKQALLQNLPVPYYVEGTGANGELVLSGGTWGESAYFKPTKTPPEMTAYPVTIRLASADRPPLTVTWDGKTTKFIPSS